MKSNHHPFTIVTGTLDFRLRGLEALTPGPPTSPPIMDPSSTTSNIVIRWSAASPLASVAESPLFYRVNYTLVRSSGETITDSIIVSLLSTCMSLTYFHPLPAHVPYLLPPLVSLPVCPLPTLPSTCVSLTSNLRVSYL